MNGKLNNTFVKELEFKDKEYFVWDTELANFGVKVNKTKKTFVAQGRIKGKTKRITVGSFGVFTVDVARKRAMEILVDLQKGIDRKKMETEIENQKITLQEVFDEYSKNKHLSKKTLYDYKNLLNRNFGDWLNKPITNITPDLVSERFMSITHKSIANYSFRVLSALINYVNDREFIHQRNPLFVINPCKILQINKSWYKLEPRQTKIKDNQILDFLKATEINDFDTDHIKIAKQHCRFLLFTGLRTKEAASMRWSDVDFIDKTIIIPQTKNKKKQRLPLGRKMIEFLKDIKENQHPKSKFIFPSKKSLAGYLSNSSKSRGKIKNLAGFSFMYHDLRRSFASIVAICLEKKYSTETIKRLLNHSYDKNDVTSGYIVYDIEDLRAPIQDIEDYIFSFENKD